MDGSQMAKPNKKRASLDFKLGRPKSGALSSFPKQLVERIYQLRDTHSGWGAITIRIELEEEYGYSSKDLPSIDAINRYLKQAGFIEQRQPSGVTPTHLCQNKVKHFHDLWEMDAEGTVAVSGLGYVSNINIKDTKSKVHCMAFPVQVKGQMNQPKTRSYLWTLRLAFEQWGLPKAIQVDRDSVFIDNKTKSPFPSQVNLFLIGLGIRLCFIDVPPPQKQAMVERSHQTINRQTLQGQHYDYWKELFKFTNKRRKRINEKLPNRMLGKKAPLQAFPKAKHSGRFYQVEQEEQLFKMSRVYKYLSKCTWYRKVSKVKTISLNGQVYYLKTAQKETHVQIKFCNRAKKLIFRDVKEQIIVKLPLKNFSIHDILGGSSKSIISMKKKLFRVKDFPL